MSGFEDFFGCLVNGVTLGAIYALIAVGYTMVYGIIKLINFAHGEVFMFGTFIGLILVNTHGFNLGFAILLAMVGCVVIGGLLDWTAYLPLRRNKLLPDILSTVGLIALAVVTLLFFITWQKQAMDTVLGKICLALLFIIPVGLFAIAVLETLGVLGPPRRMFESDRLSALITAIGMSLTMQTLAMLIWGPDYHAFSGERLPEFLQDRVLGLPILFKEVLVWVAALVLMVTLHILVTYTKAGKAMRACSQDKKTAMLMGINVNRIIILTFMTGSAMAAVAGILYAIKAGGNISFRMGYYPGVIAFAAAVLGGIGNIKGAMIGGALLGLTQGLCSGYISSAYDFAFAFGAMVLMILVRPWGLLGKPGAARA
ncbi:MAG: branched-chain amino acid ABC transporter permease [Planctomycetota bacterium]|jgi:branched-chain amino acid transport system permease protein